MLSKVFSPDKFWNSEFRSALCWDCTQRTVRVCYRYIVTTVGPIFKGQAVQELFLGLLDCSYFSPV